MENSIEVEDLVVDAGAGARCCTASAPPSARGCVTAACSGPSGSDKDHADAVFGGGTEDHLQVGWPCSVNRPGRSSTAAHRGIRDPVAERLPRPDRPGKCPLLRRAARPAGLRRSADQSLVDVGLGEASRTTWSRHALRWAAQPSDVTRPALLGDQKLLVLERADGGAGSVLREDPGSVFTSWPRPGRRCSSPATCDGRGGALRPPAAHPRGRS